MPIVFNKFSESELRIMRNALQFYIKHNPLKKYFNINTDEELLEKLNQMIGKSIFDE